MIGFRSVSICVHLWLVLFFLSTPLLHAQDERIVKSPNGKLAFHIFIANEGAGGYYRIAYRVLRESKPVIDTSFVALDMFEQEPMLGEKAGLVASQESSEPGEYNSLVAQYLQDGSLGRRIDVEIRIWDDGAAFRYRIPRTTPQIEFLLVEEDTEFAFPSDARTASGQPVSKLDKHGEFPLPFLAEEPGIGWVAVNEILTPGYPAVHLEVSETSVLATRLARPKPTTPIVMDALTPLVGPWHTVLIGKDSEQALGQSILHNLGH